MPNTTTTLYSSEEQECLAIRDAGLYANAKKAGGDRCTKAFAAAQDLLSISTPAVPTTLEDLICCLVMQAFLAASTHTAGINGMHLNKRCPLLSIQAMLIPSQLLYSVL